jgi:hypothetical protein
MPTDGTGKESAGERRNSLGRTILIWVCIVLGCLGLIASVFAIWAHVLLFDTDQWVDTLGPLLEAGGAGRAQRAPERAIVEGAAGSSSARASGAGAGFVAPAIAEASRDLLDRRLERFFSREGVQEAWVEAIRYAHQTVVAILRDESAAIQTEDGKIVLNLFPLLGVALNEVQQAGLLPDNVTLPDLRGDSPQQGRQELEQALGAWAGLWHPAAGGERPPGTGAAVCALVRSPGLILPIQPSSWRRPSSSP